MIVNYWPTWFRALYGGGWPLDYCSVDVETSGFSFAEDVVTEWGHTLVEDGKVKDQLSLIIDWSDRDTPPDWWLQSRLVRVKREMEAAGKSYHITYDKMRAEGMKPEKAFAFIRRFTNTIANSGIPFVFHNGFFDEKMLSANFLQFQFAEGYSFGDRIIDTAGIEKATQLPNNPRMHPREGDTLRDYFTRVKYTRAAGIKSNMDDHCFDKYKFDEVHGICRTDMHGAKQDSFCGHILMEEYRKLITDPDTPPVSSAANTRTSRNAVPPPRVAPVVGKRVRGVRRS